MYRQYRQHKQHRHLLQRSVAILLVALSIAVFAVPLFGCSANDPAIGDFYLEGTYYYWDGAAWQPVANSSGNVTAALVITDNTIVRGDGGACGIQDSGVTLDDFGNIDTNGGDLTGFDVNATNDLNAQNDLEVTDDAEIGGLIRVDEGIHILGNYLIGWYDATDTTVYAYIDYDGSITIFDDDDGDIILDADTGNITMDSFVELRGDARVYNSEWIDAGGIEAPGTKPATAIAHGLLETPAWQFANAVAGNENTVTFSLKVPNRMDISEPPVLLLGWSSASTGNCTWQLEYLWNSLNEDTSAGAEETLTVSTAASATSNGLVITAITGINIPSSTDVCIHCRLTRMSAAATDTIADTVELHGIGRQWVSNKLGGKI